MPSRGRSGQNKHTSASFKPVITECNSGTPSFRPSLSRKSRTRAWNAARSATFVPLVAYLGEFLIVEHGGRWTFDQVDGIWEPRILTEAGEDKSVAVALAKELRNVDDEFLVDMAL